MLEVFSSGAVVLEVLPAPEQGEVVLEYFDD